MATAKPQAAGEASPAGVPSRHARVQDRAAAGELLFLVRRVACATQVDEVEVDAVDVRPTEIGAAEVGLADFLRVLEVAVVEVVGVEAGAAALAGDGAADQAAAR